MLDSAIANPFGSPEGQWMETFDPYVTPENPLFSFYPPSACSDININCGCIPSFE